MNTSEIFDPNTINKVDTFIGWLESKVAEANPKIPNMWVIKINNEELTKEDRSMISLLDNADSDFIRILYRKGYNEFEVGIGSIDYTNCTEIRYIKKYE